MINAYTIMMASVIFLAYFMHGNRKQNKAFIILGCAAMFVILGLRDAFLIGNDSTTSYLHNFEEMADRDWPELKGIPFKDNPGLPLLMKLVYIATKGDYQALIIIISAFVMIVFAHFIYKYSCNPLQSFIYYWGLLLYPFMFNALKQSIAMSFILLAFDAIVDKKLIRFIVLVLIAAFFHFPAIVFMPAYFIAKMKIDKGYFLMLVVMLIFTFFFKDKILDLMVSVYDTELPEETTKRFLSNKALIMLVIVAAAIILRPPAPEDKLYNKLLPFMGIAIVFQTFCSYNNTFERLADYYFQFAVIFIPFAFEKIELKKSILPPELQSTVKSIAPVLFCAFGVWRFADYVQSASSFMLPYHFCF